MTCQLSHVAIISLYNCQWDQNYMYYYVTTAGKVTAGLAESNCSLPLGGRVTVTCGLTACTLGSAPSPTLSNEYGKSLPFTETYEPTTVTMHIFGQTEHLCTSAFLVTCEKFLHICN